MSREAKLTTLALAGILVLFSGLSIPYIRRGYLVDDTFIHLQFAKNLRALAQFSFNPGQPVYGATSPLWVALLACATFTLDDLPTVSRWLAFGIGLACIVVFWAFARQLLPSAPLAIGASLLFAVDPYFLRWTNAGMETSLSVLLVLITLWIHLSERQSTRLWRWSPVAAAVAYLVRPECALLLPIIACDTIARSAQRRLGVISALLGLVGFLAVCAPWLLYATLEFGTVIPTTSIAKGAYDPSLSQGFRTFLRALQTLGSTHAIPCSLILGAVVILFVRHGLRGLREFWGRHLWVWAWILGLLSVYIAGGNIVSRYLLMVTPLLTVYAFLCLGYLVRPDCLPQLGRRPAACACMLLGVAWAANLAISWGLVIPAVQSRYLEHMTMVGKWLNENTSATAVVAADEIGIIGFYSERQILDLEGLITPEIVPYKYRTQDAATARLPLKGATFEFLMLARPDYLVHQSSREYSLTSTPTGASVFEPLLSYVHADNMLAHWAADSARYVNLYRCHWETVREVTAQ